MNIYKFTHILDNKFKIGFEIEICVRNEDKLKNILLNLNNEILFHNDGSINPNNKLYKGIEILTPPLLASDAINLLEKIFEIIKNNNCFTNKSCGLHVNISPIKKGDYFKVNPFWLANQSIWKKMKKTFKRERNKYCQNIKISRIIKKNPTSFLKYVKDGKFWNYDTGIYSCTLKKKAEAKNSIALWHLLNELNTHRRLKRIKRPIKCHFHYAVCNFWNYHSKRQRDSRLEIRAMGGIDYHLKFDKIIHYVNKTLEIIQKSYLKKLSLKS